MSKDKQYDKDIKEAERLAYFAASLLIIAGLLLAIMIYDPTLSMLENDNPVVEKTLVADELDEDRIENGIHVRTGLIDAEGLMEVVNNCTFCHSAKLVIQNRMDAKRWDATIKWMQETQNLWELGSNQKVIVDYLVKNYPPIDKGRRENLITENWYELEN